MGISGLIPLLEKASQPINLRDIKGSVVAVDAYVLIHKGVFGCADKLARGEDCDGYVTYVMKYVSMLKLNKVTPIMVFDGRHLPAKAVTEKNRRKDRETAKNKAKELLRLDRGTEAMKYMRSSIDVTHKMALKVIQACRKEHVDCIVAPFEADAQLAYLNIKKIVDFVITEDSDLIVFGAPRVIFKMDLAGNGLLMEREKIQKALNVRENLFSETKFRHMCIISGCDYLPSLQGIGLAKAQKFVFFNTNPDMNKALSRIGLHLNMPKLVVTDEYKEQFMKADKMFQYQPVYDPLKRKLVYLTEPDKQTEEQLLSLVPDSLPDNKAFNVALGNLDPFTLEQLDTWNPDEESKINDKFRTTSIWSLEYDPSRAKNIKKPFQSAFVVPVSGNKEGMKLLTNKYSPSYIKTNVIMVNEKLKEEEEKEVLDGYKSKPLSTSNKVKTSPVKSSIAMLDENIEDKKEEEKNSRKSKLTNFLASFKKTHVQAPAPFVLRQKNIPRLSDSNEMSESEYFSSASPQIIDEFKPETPEKMKIQSHSKENSPLDKSSELLREKRMGDDKPKTITQVNYISKYFVRSIKQ